MSTQQANPFNEEEPFIQQSGTQQQGQPQEQMVTVKVGGVEMQVPLSEAIAGYSREQDYRKKTMDLAEERRQMEKSLEDYNSLRDRLNSDPVGTVTALAEAYGVETLDTDPSVDEDLSPEDRRVAALEAELKQLKDSFNDTKAVSAVEKEMQALQAKFPDSDPDATLKWAHDNGFGRGQLEHAYKAMMFDQAPTDPPAGTPGESDPPAEPPAEPTKDIFGEPPADPLQRAPRVSSSAPAVANGAEPEGPPQSIAEAMEAALSDLG